MFAFFCILVIIAAGFALGVLFNNLSILQEKVESLSAKLSTLNGKVDTADVQIGRLNTAHMTVANRLDQLTPVAERVDQIALTIEGSQQDFIELTQTTDACLDELANRISSISKPKTKRVAARRKSK